MIEAPSPRSGSNAQTLNVSAEQPRPGTIILTVTGDLDLATQSAFAERVATALRPPPPQNLVVDLDGVHFLGSAGIQVLLTAQTTARDVGTQLRLITASRIIRRPLEILGLDGVLDLRESRAHAGV
jgi:anti-sigma B factor antagonist